MQTINIPPKDLKSWNLSNELNRRHRWAAEQVFKQIKALNRLFFKACQNRIYRKLAGVSYSLDVGLFFCGDKIFAKAKLCIYLGRGQNAYLDCSLKKTGDSDKMCELAIKIYALRED